MRKPGCSICTRHSRTVRESGSASYASGSIVRGFGGLGHVTTWSPRSTVLRKDAAMGQDGHACMASAVTSRNSFSVAPLAA
jgi:hypothetical protein